MLSIIADTHTHTVSSGHAFSTVTENARAARECGLEFMCVTDHGPKVPGAPSFVFFLAMVNQMPRVLEGVNILCGAEVNVIDWDGSLDLSPKLLNKLEWVIASMHVVSIEPADVASHTHAWLRVAENPLVDVMGHMGDARYPFEHEPVIRACAEHGKIVEINNHSFSGRPGSADNCKDIACLCAKYHVPVVVSTDAHFWTMVGNFEKSIAMLKEISFPEELILNADYDRFAAVAAEKAGRIFIR